MAALTNSAESGLLNHFFRGIALPSPSNVYVGLLGAYVSQTVEAGDISAEVTGSSGFTRKVAPCNTNVWSAPYTSGTATAVHNLSGIEFDVAGTSKGWVTGVIIAKTISGGGEDVLFHGQLTNAREIRQGDQFIFPSGSLKITFD